MTSSFQAIFLATVLPPMTVSRLGSAAVWSLCHGHWQLELLVPLVESDFHYTLLLQARCGTADSCAGGAADSLWRGPSHGGSLCQL